MAYWYVKAPVREQPTATSTLISPTLQVSDAVMNHNRLDISPTGDFFEK
jgi:hypothetical protein